MAAVKEISIHAAGIIRNNEYILVGRQARNFSEGFS